MGSLPATSGLLDATKASDLSLARFVRNNVRPHKASGYAIVDIALKVPGETPGDAVAEPVAMTPGAAAAFDRRALR